MPNITIREQDLTYTNVSEEISNAVFIPGFSIARVNMRASDDDYAINLGAPNGVPAGTPKLCKTISEFTSYFGTAPIFSSSEPWPEVVNIPTPDAPETLSGFTPASLTKLESNMVNAGDIDKSWLMAYELISAGIPVVYNRVNKFTGLEEILTEQSARPTNIVSKQAVETGIVPKPIVGDLRLAGAGAVEGIINMSMFIITQVDSVSDSDNYIITWERYDDVLYPISTSQTSYTPTSSTISLKTMYDALSTMYQLASQGVETNVLCDKNALDISYITSGGYPAFEYLTPTTIFVQDWDSEIQYHEGNKVMFTDSGVTNCYICIQAALGSEQDPSNTDYWSLSVAKIASHVIAPSMSALAKYRGDCIALIDHVDNPYRPLVGNGSVFNSIRGTFSINSEFGAMFTPWYSYGSSQGAVTMPGSFAYLIALANSVKSNASWLAVSGVARGVVPGARALHTFEKLTNSIADYFTNSLTNGGICINPITNIHNYGLTIWGNRTLMETRVNSEQAAYYLNMRKLINEVKKSCYRAAQTLMFEQNSDVLWINFKSKIVPLLDRMKTSNGISGYQISRVTSNKKTEVKAKITLFPIYAVEEFTIDIVLTNDDTEVTEG